MLGQNRLKTKFKSYTFKTLPKTMLFIGESGCGKHTFITELAENLSCNLIEVGLDFTFEQLIEFQQSPVDTLYLINLELFNEKQQNKILKFIEEPRINMSVALICDSELKVLPTILNRCIKYYFESYSKEDLSRIKQTDSPILYRICSTPGQLLASDLYNIDMTYSKCLDILDTLVKESSANILGISQLINYKEDYNKINFNIFLKVMKLIAYEKYINTQNNLYFVIYNYTCIKLQEKQNMINPNEGCFVLQYLIGLKEVANKWN